MAVKVPVSTGNPRSRLVTRKGGGRVVMTSPPPTKKTRVPSTRAYRGKRR